jgi:type IV secretion system protein VirB11
MTIDIIVHIKAHAGRRYITGIDFNPERRLASDNRQ